MPGPAVFPPFFDNLVECRIAQRFQGIDILSVMFVERAGLDTFTAEAMEINLAIGSFYDTLAGESLSTSWSVVERRLIDRSVAAGSEFLDFGAIPGLNAGDPLPHQTQAVITWRTGIAGPRYRGRTFIGGWQEGSNDADGDMAATTATVLFDAGTQLLADFVADGHAMQVLSRGNTSPPAPDAWSAFHTPVTACVVNREWDILRSRRR